jgi:tetratricopeptide (TPR) repeat protein
VAKEDSPTPLKRYSTLLGGISEYVAAVLAYILALTGGAQTPYPQTISVLTALATSLALWLLRWPHISKKAESLILPERSGQSPHSLWGRLLSPFSARTGYAMPLLRRRVEGSLLLILSIVTIAFSGAKFSSVYDEISWIRCSGAKDQAFKILVAKFTLSAKEQTTVESQLIAALERDLENTTICYYRKNAEFRDEAIQLGEKYEAALVIWGSIDSQILQIGMEPTGWDALGTVVNIPKSEAMEFRANQMDDVIPFLSQYVLSEILYMRGDTLQARSVLNDYLSGLDAQRMERIGSKNLAEAYFFLGTLFDPEISASGDDQQAINAYNKALQLNPGLSGALLNRGLAFYNRGEYEKATADLQASIQITPDDANAYHFLGVALLFDNRFEEAQQIYAAGVPYMNLEERSVYIGELEFLANAYPELKGPITKITMILREGIPSR